MNPVQIYGKDPTCTYYMNPRDGLRHIRIHRTRDPTRPGEEVDIRYPCSDLGPLKSHVYPNFVIINAALKLHDNARAFDATAFEHYPTRPGTSKIKRMLALSSQRSHISPRPVDVGACSRSARFVVSQHSRRSGSDYSGSHCALSERSRNKPRPNYKKLAMEDRGW
jgi:hypothetical protein